MLCPVDWSAAQGESRQEGEPVFLEAIGETRTCLVPSSFRPFFTPEERSLIAGQYGGVRFNGETVRLEGLEQEVGRLELLLSPSCYFDLLSTNLLLSTDTSRWSSEAQGLQKRIRKASGADDLRRDPTRILACPLLANDIAVSILLHTPDGRFLLARRSSAVALSAGSFSVSATGALDERDLHAENPVLSCACREVEEELGLSVHEEDLAFRGIFIGPAKLQPIALVDGEVTSFQDISTNFEVVELLSVTRAELASDQDVTMSEASHFHLSLWA